MRRLAIALALCTTIIMPIKSLAFGWQGNESTGWWYGINEDNTSWYQNGWHWVDGNNDGIAECYYFQNDGYALRNTIAPDGSQVNASGAWVIGEAVQTKSLGLSVTSSTLSQEKNNQSATNSVLSENSKQEEDFSAYTYIGNKNTHKFHRSSCKSVKAMNESNKVGLSSRDEAIVKRYEPCKICNP